MISKNKIYLSTIAENAGDIARQYGLGIEIAEFCTAYNMDEHFAESDKRVQQQIANVPARLLHGPFNELFPCAIDPLARELASKRYKQALDFARKYSAEKLILHGGYVPRLYYPIWYTEQSILFWKDFLGNNPGNYRICLENVLEEEPEMLFDIVQGVDDPRLRLCLDVGHVNAYSHVPVLDWISRWGRWLDHVHLHNNDGTADTHSAPNCGTLPIEEILHALPDVTLTLELPHIGGAVDWILERSNHP